MVSKNWLAFPVHLIFWYAIFLKHHFEHYRTKNNTQCFNTIHSWPKEMHHLKKKPSLRWLQCDLGCFVMSPKRHVLKQVTIARDPWGISQQSFLQVTLRTIWQNVHDPGSGSVSQGHREKWVQKSCVSFEGECSTEIMCRVASVWQVFIKALHLSIHCIKTELALHCSWMTFNLYFYILQHKLICRYFSFAVVECIGEHVE